MTGRRRQEQERRRGLQARRRPPFGRLPAVAVARPIACGLPYAVRLCVSVVCIEPWTVDVLVRSTVRHPEIFEEILKVIFVNFLINAFRYNLSV
uniref:Uncharacterized protein n=1 Tax=Leersia perrieri TaxID=77586 RepID=A0A0D9VRJ1_9ORYZ